jgi:anti-sigma regulatory factor (Ser/Thr protein kinase)
MVCRGLDDSFEVEIRDRGVAYDPDEKPIRPPEEIRVGGRGVYLMRALMDEVNYHREGDVNCVRMKKLLKTHA